MQLTEADIAGMNESLLIRALEIQWEFKHLGESAVKAMPRLLKVGRSTYIQAKMGRGHLGIVKLFEMQKLCESNLVDRFIESKR